jgi:caspase-like apoptosis-related cysteine protease
MSVAEETSISNIPNTNGDTNGHSMQSDSVPIPQRRPSSNLTELLQNANGSNPSSPLTSRQNSVFVRSQQSSFECREDEEITNPDPKLIQELGMMMSQNGSNGNGKEENMNDENDAWPSNPFSRPNQSHQNVAAMPVERDSEYYNMNHKKRGLAFIFNHKHFDPRLGLKQRNGTDADRDNLRITLRQLEFEVNVYNDLPFKEMERILEQASAETNHSDHDCIFIAVLSHGELGILYASDHAYKPDRLWTHFNAEKCPTLAGKPKMFFIQACQGDQLDSGVHLKRVSNTETDSNTMSYKIPSHADFLIVYSTIPGFYSWRNTTAGSWFVQALCNVLQRDRINRDGRQRDLLSCLTRVARKVAFDFQSNTPGDVVMHEKKQIPCITSMLTRDVYFHRKV